MKFRSFLSLLSGVAGVLLLLGLTAASPAGAATSLPRGVGAKSCGGYATYGSTTYYACVRHLSGGMTVDVTATTGNSGSGSEVMQIHMYKHGVDQGLTSCLVNMGSHSSKVFYWNGSSNSCASRLYLYPVNDTYAGKGHIYGDDQDSTTGSIYP